MSRESARSLVDRMKSEAAFAAAILALGALGEGELEGIAGGACKPYLFWET